MLARQNELKKSIYIMETKTTAKLKVKFFLICYLYLRKDARLTTIWPLIIGGHPDRSWWQVLYLASTTINLQKNYFDRLKKLGSKPSLRPTKKMTELKAWFYVFPLICRSRARSRFVVDFSIFYLFFYLQSFVSLDPQV